MPDYALDPDFRLRRSPRAAAPTGGGTIPEFVYRATDRFLRRAVAADGGGGRKA